MKTRHRKKGQLLKDVIFVLALILAVAFIYVGLRFSLATDTPLVAISGQSMNPTLEDGDLTVVRGVPAEEIKVGDIIVFDPQNGVRTVHRVTRIQTLENGTLTFKTKGDALDGDDPYTVYPENIHGRLLYRIPYLGYLFLNPTILIIIIAIIVVIIILWPERKGRFHHKTKTRSPTVEAT